MLIFIAVVVVCCSLRVLVRIVYSGLVFSCACLGFVLCDLDWLILRAFVCLIVVGLRLGVWFWVVWL